MMPLHQIFADILDQHMGRPRRESETRMDCLKCHQPLGATRDPFYHPTCDPRPYVTHEPVPAVPVHALDSTYEALLDARDEIDEVLSDVASPTRQTLYSGIKDAIDDLLANIDHIRATDRGPR